MESTDGLPAAPSAIGTRSFAVPRPRARSQKPPKPSASHFLIALFYVPSKREEMVTDHDLSRAALIVQIIGTVLVTMATGYYAWLTRKLWRETARNAEITERMLAIDNEPLCSITKLHQSYLPDRLLSLEFEVQNAGRVPVDSVYLLSEWKGTSRDDPQRADFTSEWIGVLLPGQSVRCRHARRVNRLAITEQCRKGDSVEYEIAVVHIALSVKYENSLQRQSPKLHVLMAEFVLQECIFRVRKSEMVTQDTGNYKLYHLLDDVSAIGHGVAPASLFDAGRI